MWVGWPSLSNSGSDLTPAGGLRALFVTLKALIGSVTFLTQAARSGRRRMVDSNFHDPCQSLVSFAGSSRYKVCSAHGRIVLHTLQRAWRLKPSRYEKQCRRSSAGSCSNRDMLVYRSHGDRSTLVSYRSSRLLHGGLDRKVAWPDQRRCWPLAPRMLGCMMPRWRPHLFIGW
jgi:hypothetical protein